MKTSIMQSENQCQTEQQPPLTHTHHVVDIFENGGEAADDQGELVLGDVDQTLLVVLCADFGVSVLVSHFDGELKQTERGKGFQYEAFSDISWDNLTLSAVKSFTFGI